jgi:beta-lactamase regulating signal transducer with metallopeptidase domain
VFSWLAHNTLCALPIAVLALVARIAAPKRPALEHALWLLVFLRLIVPPLQWESGLDSPSRASVLGLVSSEEPGPWNALMGTLARSFGSNWSTWATRGLVVLFLGFLARIAWRELVRARAVELCVRQARDADGRLQRHVDEIAARLGSDPPRVRLSPEAASPFLWSLRRPVLVLPVEQALPEPTVLAHEFAHLRRRDHWSAWLELIVQAFHFWNPLFWLARRRMHLAAELSCDQWVVARFPAERRGFAAALVEAAERSARGNFVPRAVQAIGADARDFEERLKRILSREAPPSPRASLLGAAALGGLLSFPGFLLPTLAEFRAALPALPSGLDRTALERSLAGADGVLRENPSSGAAWAQRGVALLSLGRLEEALASFEQQEGLGYQSAKALYNQGCALVRLGRTHEALERLALAYELGLDVARNVAADPDFEPVRGTAEFQGFLARLEEAQPE